MVGGGHRTAFVLQDLTNLTNLPARHRLVMQCVGISTLPARLTGHVHVYEKTEYLHIIHT